MILARKLLYLIRDIPLRHRIAAAVIAVPCFGVVAAFGIAPATLLEPISVSSSLEELSLPPLTPLTEPNATFTRDERIQRGDTVASLFARLQIEDAAALRRVLGDAQAKALRQLVPGRTLQAVTNGQGGLVSLRYLNGNQLLTVDHDGSDYTIKQVPAQLEQRVLMKSAEITSSLFGATDAAGLPDSVAMQIADIFSTDIDFHSDLRKGDHFSVLYEASYHHGELVAYGRVLAAEFTNGSKTYQALYFKDSDGGGAYYTMDGKSLRKQFLRSPLEFSRVTSGFSNARFHPLLREWRAHTGIDFGAPSGTRVRATADGVVEFAGPRGGYGNLIMLRHRSNYETYYGHLSAFTRGLKRGQRVTQGDVIGYVGQTGLATGPHLHYEFRVGNVSANPLRMAMPAAAPIGPAQRQGFDQIAGQYKQRLALLHSVNLARLD